MKIKSGIHISTFIAALTVSGLSLPISHSLSLKDEGNREDTISESRDPAISSSELCEALEDDYLVHAIIVRVRNDRCDYSREDFAEVRCTAVSTIYHSKGKNILRLAVERSTKGTVTEYVRRLVSRDDVIYAEPDVDGEWFVTPSEFGNPPLSSGRWFVTK